MTVELPSSIEAYFQADRDGGPEAVAATFTEDAVVTDVGEKHEGQAAIRTWKARSSQKYTYTVDPIAIASGDGKTQVTGHVVGDFPGSPVDLRYSFVVAGDKIAALEITV